MTDLEIRRALSEAAGWEWVVEEMERGDYLRRVGWACKEHRLFTDEPLSFNDVHAACEAAGYTELRLRYGDWRARGKEWRADIRLRGEPLFSFAYGTAELDAIAMALIAAHRERTRIESGNLGAGPVCAYCGRHPPFCDCDTYPES